MSRYTCPSLLDLSGNDLGKCDQGLVDVQIERACRVVVLNLNTSEESDHLRRGARRGSRVALCFALLLRLSSWQVRDFHTHLRCGLAMVLIGGVNFLALGFADRLGLPFASRSLFTRAGRVIAREQFLRGLRGCRWRGMRRRMRTRSFANRIRRRPRRTGRDTVASQRCMVAKKDLAVVGAVCLTFLQRVALSWSGQLADEVGFVALVPGEALLCGENTVTDKLRRLPLFETCTVASLLPILVDHIGRTPSA
mmetsp:Transcript_7596/g.23699  ORF Transcript_7596/g.23699 Transcript_7596/m.23699 type:complete len:252 (-) Transcript_7596:130-885(-)